MRGVRTGDRMHGLWGRNVVTEAVAGWHIAKLAQPHRRNFTIDTPATSRRTITIMHLAARYN